MRNYLKTDPITRDEAEKLIRGGNSEDISRSLVRLAYHDSDWIWVQNVCLSLASHKDKWVRRTCATCFGHIARIHGRIQKDKVVPTLQKMLQDPEVRGAAQDAIEDLKVFAPQEGSQN